MNRREFSKYAVTAALTSGTQAQAGKPAREQMREARPSGGPSKPPPVSKGPEKLALGRWQAIHPGIWKVTLGQPEEFTPVKLRHREVAEEELLRLPHAATSPISAHAIRGRQTKRGYLLRIELDAYELVYGLGLQLMSFIQRGLKKTVRINADPKADSGDSHAPVPFYVTTKGYGILIDSARYVTFYLGRKTREDEARGQGTGAGPGAEPKTVPKELLPDAEFASRFGQRTQVVAEVPLATGVDVYVFSGPSMREAVQRFNLFAGGGCLPPRWGLGFWYRCDHSFDERQVLDLASDLRRSQIPCDVLGLEPGWQGHSYSCSYVWSDKFADPKAMLEALAAQGYRTNLWEHAFTHPSSPIHAALLPYAGDYEVWDGLVPDFTLPEARRIFADFHEKEHVERGVAGYKLDECDNSDFTGGWSFPECSRFPSGVDGEQMHSLFGLGYQETIDSLFRRRNARSYHLVRSSHALAAPYPAVLYSDLYDHKQFIRALVNAGFSGLLWCPEVRDAVDAEDLIRRLQVVCLSPLAMVNAWYIKNPPWKQVKTEANNAGEFAPGWQELERACREIIRLRMSLIPYLYAAFVRYHQEGLPPFRALVMDYPSDPRVWTIDDQYLVGENLLVAPVTSGTTKRDIYLPKGEWYDFWTGKPYVGEQKFAVDVPLNTIPVFVKAGSLLPLAEPTLHTGESSSRKLTVRVYGDGSRPATVFEDDDFTLNFTKGDYNRLSLTWDNASRTGRVVRIGQAKCPQYEIMGWQQLT